jgi:hypothetical protein
MNSPPRLLESREYSERESSSRLTMEAEPPRRRSTALPGI